MALKYSTLLNYLMKLTGHEVAKKEKTMPAIEDFLSVLFSVLAVYKPPMGLIPGGIRGVVGVREELDAMLLKVGEKVSDLDEARKSFESFDFEHFETRDIRENALSIVLEYAETVNQSTDYISTPELWDAIMIYPTLSVKRIVFGMGEKDEETPLDMDKLWSSVFNGEGGDILGEGSGTDDDDDYTFVDDDGDDTSDDETSDDDDDEDSAGDGGSDLDSRLDQLLGGKRSSIFTEIIGGTSGTKSGTSSGSSSGSDSDSDESDDDSDDATPIFDFFDEPTQKGKKSGAKSPTTVAEVVEKTKHVRDKLLEAVRGQNAAIDTFVSGYFRAETVALVKKKRKKPRATFLFAGPPGVGKTFLAEQAAEHLGLPYRRFDMSEYADKEATISFCGSDKVYKNGQPGVVTSFVAENPHSVLLFDEIEKAHINVIYLFLQMLDAGRLRDTFTNEEVSFTDAIVILTTNAGRNLYEDPSIVNLSALPRRQIIEALRNDKSERGNDMNVFPSALCSRFAAGNVIMFDRLEAYDLCNIANKELKESVSAFSKYSGIKVTLDPSLGTAILLAEGAKSDARTVSSRSGSFFYDEVYELFRLVGKGENSKPLDGITSLDIKVTLPEDEKVRSLFVNSEAPSVLVFGDGELGEECKKKLADCTVYHASDINDARDILFAHDVTIALCDIQFGKRADVQNYINIEDTSSLGMDFLHLICSEYDIPAFILERKRGDISHEEALSFARCGVRDIISMDKTGGGFAKKVMSKCSAAYQQKSLLELSRASKVLTYKTAQTVSEDGTSAEIHLFDMGLALAADTEDAKNLLVSKPNVKFADVIGAEDAKSELKYFVEYMKCPVKYIRRGLRAPKGILLYGPPGTGKTLLAKAMAGESDVTFIAAEGNRFLQRYVGEGAAAVHDLFTTARKYAPSILFIDEIDAIGKNRASASAEHSSDILTAFLTEMDGFNTDSSKPVFVLAATNYDIDGNTDRTLDPALLRRFDRKLLVDLPNKEERARYIRFKMSKNPALELCDEQIDNISMRSTGMSLAELESVIELAMRNAVRNENLVVDDASLEEAFETFTGGEEKKWSEDSLIRTARHEAGHALLCWLSGEKPSYVTIVARGNHGGYMQHGDEENKGLYTRKELLAKIRTSLAGRAAEVVYYGEDDGVSTGAGSDLANATRLAERMVCFDGMDTSFGLAVISHDSMSGYYAEVRTRVNSILNGEYVKACSVIEKNRAAIDALCEALIAQNHLRGLEIDEIFAKYVTD